jgi:Spy/CpxP family protein refolding chaperone
MNRTIWIGVPATALVLALSLIPAWADGSHGTADLLVNLVNHAGELGLGTDQIATLKAIQLDLDLTRIKAETGIMLIEREIAGMIMDETVELSAIEDKIAQSKIMEAGLRVSGVKALRRAIAVLTPSQREKLGAGSPKLKREDMRS